MKRLILVLAVVAALAIPGAAWAGCWATVGLSSLPKPGLQAGKPWVATGTLFRFKGKRNGDRRLVPSPSRLSDFRPLQARRLRRFSVQGVREGPHLPVGSDRRGLIGRAGDGAGAPPPARRLRE